MLAKKRPHQDHLDALHASIVASNHEEERLKQCINEGDPLHQRRERYLTARNWRLRFVVYSVDKKHGYYGVAYVRQVAPGEIDILFAHRGTCFNQPGNIKADIDILEKHPNPPILTEAVEPFVGSVLQSLRDTRIRTIRHTGFSLGGFIAGAMTARSQAENVYAITFDAPGCAYLLPNTERTRKANKVINFVTAPNGVNTCNEHLGKVYQFTHFYTPAGSEQNPHHHALFCGVEITKEKMLTLMELGETVKTHNLKALLNEFDRGSLTVVKPYKWPTAHVSFTYGPQREMAYHDKYTKEVSLQSFFDSTWPLLIWTATCGRSGQAHHGVTSLFYRRDNTVCYTEQEYKNRLLSTGLFWCALLIVSIAAINAQTRHTAEAQQHTGLRPKVNH